MDSIKKFIKKVIKKLKLLNKNINFVHKKSNKYELFLFFDIIWCLIRYGITSNEYRIFEFYDLKSYKRNSFVSKRRYNHIIRKLVNKKVTNIINNKDKFNNRFKDYLNRDLVFLDKLNFKQTEDIILKNKVLIGRSNRTSFISSYKEYDIKDYRSPAFLSKDMKDNKDYIAEYTFNQIKDLNKINNIVFINVVSVYDKDIDIVSSTIEFKKDDIVYTGYVDLQSKCIKGNIKDDKGNNYKENFDGFKIPKFDKIIEIVKEVSKELTEIQQVEWSFIVGNKDIYLVDGNIWDDYVFSQMREYLDDDEGLMNYYKKFFL